MKKLSKRWFLPSLLVVTFFIVLGVFSGNLSDWYASQKIDIKIANNPEKINKPSKEFPFAFGPLDNKDYDMLLKDYLIPGMNEMWGPEWQKDNTWDKATKIRIWVREFLDNGYWYGKYNGKPYTDELFTVRDILEWRNAGNDGLCSYYATFYMHSLLANGIQARRVGWWKPDGGGDQLTEVYVPKFQKWVAVSPLFNMWWEDEKGEPMNVVEMNQYIHSGKRDIMKRNRDGQDTLPDGNYDDGVLLRDWAWDVYIWDKNGYLFGENPNFVEYADPRAYPYERGYQANLITDENVINFDAQLIQINKPKIHLSSLDIEIKDYFMPNFDHFEWHLYKRVDEEESVEISDGEFITQKTSIPIPKEKGIYELKVYAKNARGGNSNKVKILVQREDS